MAERGVSALLDSVERARGVLEAEDKAREKLLTLTREIVRLSRQAIFKLHDGDLAAAESLLKHLRAMVEELLAFKESSPRLYYGGSVTAALAEYVEANALYCYLKGEEMQGYEALRVEPVHFLLGLADFTGELRRLLLRHLSSGDYASAARELKLMEEVYRALVSIAVPEALVPGLRRKIDVLRALIESSVRDFHYSLTSNNLERAVKALLGELHGRGV
ncbi:MAG: hypothetical protein QXG48_00075 [Thermofilaceae archaeon]